MNITQIKRALESEGGARAYWCHTYEPLTHRGDRGSVLLYDDSLFFVSDNNEKNYIPVQNADTIHIPAIGHYSW